MAFAERFLTTPDPIEVAGRHVKRYHINIDDADVDEQIRAAAVPQCWTQCESEAGSTPRRR